MIVVSSDAVAAMLADPIYARLRLQGIFHQIAQTQTQVVRLLNGLECRPVSMNVRQQKDSHKLSR
jgi:hypothetical protein